MLNNGKQVGNVKGFKVTGEAEQKMTNEERIKLTKGAINHVDINYNRFDIMHCKIVTKQMVNTGRSSLTRELLERYRKEKSIHCHTVIDTL